jgi:hypothetical protein
MNRLLDANMKVLTRGIMKAGFVVANFDEATPAT